MRNEMLWKNVDDFSLPQKAQIFAEEKCRVVLCYVSGDAATKEFGGVLQQAKV
jgi:hypothetical protein